jgi:hypothetical protein
MELRHLDNESTTIDRVDHDPAALEGVVAPSAATPVSDTTALIVVILGVHIEESNFLDFAAIRLARNRAHVQDSQASLVVALVRKSIVDELVVVDRANRALIEPRVHWLLEIRDVKDIGRWETVLGWRIGVGASWADETLVKLIIENEVGLPVGIEDPTLVGV